jgi:type VI secretion system protein ImpA
MMVAEELLKPVSDEAPCGEDLSYDASFQALETMARGKPETQFSAAEPPDWKELRSRCLELFARSKDLRIAILLSVAEIELEALAGFRESLALIKGVIERYWTTVHPQLDPADNNDPLQRINIIASIAMPIGVFGDPLRVLERIQAIPLCNSIQMGRYSLADILRVEAGTTVSGDKPATSIAQIEAAFRDTNPGELEEIYRVLRDCLLLVQGMDEFLTQTVGPASAPDLTPLSAQLVLMQNRVKPYLSPPVSAGREPVLAVPTDPTATLQKPLSQTGEIRSREDVLTLLQKICDYYAQAEPSSPVPLVLKRAARLAEMDFMQIIKDMSPEAIAQIRTITGEAED